MKNIKTFKQFLNENVNSGWQGEKLYEAWKASDAKKVKSAWISEFDYEDGPLLDSMAAGWVLIHNEFKSAKPVYSAPDEFLAFGIFNGTLISVHGEANDRDFDTLNVLVAQGVDKSIFPTLLKSSPMEFASLLDDELGIDFTTETFSYNPDTKPKSALTAAKEAVAYISKNK